MLIPTTDESVYHSPWEKGNSDVNNVFLNIPLCYVDFQAGKDTVTTSMVIKIKTPRLTEFHSSSTK